MMKEANDMKGNAASLKRKSRYLKVPPPPSLSPLLNKNTTIHLKKTALTLLNYFLYHPEIVLMQ